jgi:hypothetical protein
MIKVVKLITGEELIADCELHEDGVFCKNTAIIFSNQPQKLFLGTWLPYTDAPAGVVIPHHAIMLVLNADKDMEVYYESWKNGKTNLDDK